MTVSNFAARLAADLIDDIGALDDSAGLKLTFTVEVEGWPDRHGIHEPVTVTREAVFQGGEWNWTKTTRLEELAYATVRKAK